MKFKLEYVFPLAMFILSIGASVIYFYQRDYKRGIYWIAVAIITVTVTL
jgi:hypothetical protein